MKIGAAAVENSVEIPQKAENRATYDSVILLLGICPKEMKTLI